MSLTQIYAKPVALNRETHRHVRIGAMRDQAFASKTNSVPISAVEFLEACKEYAIVFAQIGEKKTPFVLLGLRDNENLFVDAQGNWKANYLPAFVRRYPFVVAEAEGDSLLVCVDESSSAFNAEDGQALFDAEGNQTPFLDNALAFINAYQEQMLQTMALVDRLEALNLFEEKNANTVLKDGREFNFSGLFVIDENRLKELDEKVQIELVRNGAMGLIYAHLISLSNMGLMGNRLAERDAATAEAVKAV